MRTMINDNLQVLRQQLDELYANTYERLQFLRWRDFKQTVSKCVEPVPEIEESGIVTDLVIVLGIVVAALCFIGVCYSIGARC